MIASELINHMIPPLKSNDDGHKAVVWMEELRMNQLPVIEKGRFMGFITEESILQENDNKLPVSAYYFEGEQCFVLENQHFYDVIKAAAIKPHIPDEVRGVEYPTWPTCSKFAQTLD